MTASVSRKNIVAGCGIRSLLIVGFQIVYIQDSKFQCTHHQTSGIYPHPFTRREKTADQVILPFLQRLDPKRHSPKIGNHFFGIAQCQMTEETLVILINIIAYDCFMTSSFIEDRFLEAFHYLLQYRIVKDQLLAVHHCLHIGFGQQLSGFQDNAVGTGFKYVHP